MKPFLAILTLCIVLPAAAHGPTPRKTDQTILVNAAPDKVWKMMSVPCAIAEWHPQVAGCQDVSGKGRALTLKNGGKLVEGFDELLPAEMSLSYRLEGDLDIQALPVSSLSGRIRLKAEGTGTRISWMARYYRAFTGNEPPSGQDDESAEQAVNAYVSGALEGIKAFAER